MCFAGWGGTFCDEHDAGGSGTGSESGDCAEGFTGPDCLPCSEDNYDSSCEAPCDAYKCNFHGRCKGKNGACKCFDGWGGAICDQFVGGGSSDDSSYGSGSGHGSSYSIESGHASSSGSGSAPGSGKEQCPPGFTGPDCLPCLQDVYDRSCVVSCDFSTCNWHGRCNGKTGSCSCLEGWAGPRCNEPQLPGKVVGLVADGDAYMLNLRWKPPTANWGHKTRKAYVLQMKCGEELSYSVYNDSSHLAAWDLEAWFRVEWQNQAGEEHASLSSMRPVDDAAEADILAVSGEKHFLHFNGLYTKDAHGLWKHTMRSGVTLTYTDRGFKASELGYEHDVLVQPFQSGAPIGTCPQGEDLIMSVNAQSKCCDGEAVSKTLKVLALPSRVLGLSAHEEGNAIHLKWDQPADTENSDDAASTIEKYVIELRQCAGSGDIAPIQIEAKLGQAGYFGISEKHLIKGEQYSLRVAAHNSAGQGLWSEVMCVCVCVCVCMSE